MSTGNEIAILARAPAVAYLRTSTDRQPNSLIMQAKLIEAYAEQNGYEIVDTYTDFARSGLTLRGRAGLMALLREVTSPTRVFSTILVQDVSRWGRFQDADQHAAYEYLCREMGVRVEYVAEPFERDSDFPRSIMKTVKRTMAAEYSRDLSLRTVRYQTAAARRGFKLGGPVPFGFRRLVIDAEGRPLKILATGEQKASPDFRVIMVRGPDDEIAALRRLFALYADDRLPVRTIVRMLNAEFDLPPDRRLTEGRVRYWLTSELALGMYVWGRVSFWLKGHRVANPRALWVRNRVCDPLISNDQFARATERRHQNPYMTPDEILERLKRLYAESGRMSIKTIAACPDMPDYVTIRKHLGTIATVRDLVGCPPSWGRVLGRPPGEYTDEEGIAGLRRLYARHGWITQKLINGSTDLPCAKWYHNRFGNLMNAYKAAGFGFSRFDQQSQGRRRQLTPVPKTPLV